MRLKNFIWIVICIAWSALWWSAWTAWARVFNVGIDALLMVQAICDAIRDNRHTVIINAKDFTVEVPKRPE